MRNKLLIAILALVCAGGPAVAQDREARDTRPEGEARSALEQLQDRLRAAIHLPRSAEEAREAGVDRDRLREVLRAGRDNGVFAGEMTVILDTENEGLRQGGNPENFGAAVQAMKASGLRGRALAEAIHAEQAARGMKKQERYRERLRFHPGGEAKGKGSGKGQGPGQGKGPGAGPGDRGAGAMQKQAQPRGEGDEAGKKKQEAGSPGGKGKKGKETS